MAKAFLETRKKEMAAKDVAKKAFLEKYQEVNKVVPTKPAVIKVIPAPALATHRTVSTKTAATTKTTATTKAAATTRAAATTKAAATKRQAEEAEAEARKKFVEDRKKHQEQKKEAERKFLSNDPAAADLRRLLSLDD
jgi:hypothetical protein